MAHIFADNVRESSITEGTGNFTTEGGAPAPGGVIFGRRLSEVLQVGDSFDYSIFHTTNNEWEIGLGSYVSSNTFSRSPTSSSNNGSLVDFSPGTKHVFIAPVAARMDGDISDSNLPHMQTGKTFTSTVTVTGESGVRVNYSTQSLSLGGTQSDILDFSSCLRNREDHGAWYIDESKLSEGFSIRCHNQGSNLRDVFNVNPSGIGTLGGFHIKVMENVSDVDSTDFPIGSYLIVEDDGVPSPVRNAVHSVRLHSSSNTRFVLSGGNNSGSLVNGVWRSRGKGGPSFQLMERVG